MFDHLVDLTEPICQKLNPVLADMTIFDTSGIEAWVTENNPKYANRIMKQLKAFKKSHNLDDSYDPYKVAYGSMPTHAASTPSFAATFSMQNTANSSSLEFFILYFNNEQTDNHPATTNCQIQL